MTNSAGTTRTSGIVVGVDGSPSSKAALEWAAEEAKLRSLPLEIILTWEYPANFGWMPTWPENLDFEGDSRKFLDEFIDSVLGHEARFGITASVLEGRAADVLVKRSEHASLIVVGSRGHGGFAGLLIGSVSAHLAAHSRCPVLIVHGASDASDS